MEYAKYISEYLVNLNQPRSATIDGRLVTGDLPESYMNSIGWYRLERTTEPDTQDGYHAEPRYSYAYDSDDKPTTIVQSWEVVQDPPEPPKVYSKLKILMAADQAGFSEDLMDMIESDRKISYIWNASNTIEDNDLLKAYIPSIATALSKTEEEVYEFLDSYCLAD